MELGRIEGTDIIQVTSEKGKTKFVSVDAIKEYVNTKVINTEPNKIKTTPVKAEPKKATTNKTEAKK